MEQNFFDRNSTDSLNKITKSQKQIKIQIKDKKEYLPDEVNIIKK
jgi:hypothetical protein